MEIIEKFNSVMEEFNEAYTNAKDEKEAKKIDEKYESIIEEAEKELEKWIQEEFEKEQAQLEKEEQDNIDALKKQEEEDAKELEEQAVQLVISEAYEHLGDEKLGNMFTVIEHKQYAEELWIKVNGKEEDIIKQIKEFLEK